MHLVVVAMCALPVQIAWPSTPKGTNVSLALSRTVLNVPVITSAQLAAMGSPSTRQAIVSTVPVSMAVKFVQVMESVPPASLGLALATENVQSVLPPVRHAIVMVPVPLASHPSQPPLTPMVDALLVLWPTVSPAQPATKTNANNVQKPTPSTPTLDSAASSAPPTCA